MAHLLDSFGALDKLEAFVSSNGRMFYQRPVPVTLIENESGEVEERKQTVVLRRAKHAVDDVWALGEDSVVPFWAGRELDWEILED